MVRSQQRRLAPVLAACAAGLSLVAVTSAPVRAQAPHRPNVFQRHPTATGLAVGVGVHHALKVSAARKKARHQRLNFAERHPTITAIGAGVVTRHMLKKSTTH